MEQPSTEVEIQGQSMNTGEGYKHMKPKTHVLCLRGRGCSQAILRSLRATPGQQFSVKAWKCGIGDPQGHPCKAKRPHGCPQQSSAGGGGPQGCTCGIWKAGQQTWVRCTDPGLSSQSPVWFLERSPTFPVRANRETACPKPCLTDSNVSLQHLS